MCSTTNAPMGLMGTIIHFRCYQCGMMFYTEKKPTPAKR